MKKRMRLLSCILAGMLMLSACSGGGDSTQGSDSAEGGNSGPIKIGVSTDITSLDPHKHNDVPSGNATRAIYSNLIELKDNKEFVGGLAESWEYIDDMNVKFTLKSGVKFHDGSELTAEDVKFSLERQKESAKIGHLVSMVDTVEVVDNLNFIVHMNTPSNALVSSLQHSGSAIMSKNYVETLEAEGKSIEDAPMGTGQFKFKSWVPGASIELEKFEEYFNSEKVAQNDITFKVMPEESARTIALENGELDLLVNVSANDAGKIRDNAELALDEYESTQVEYMAFNTQKAPFDNPMVRQAINYAVNKDDVLIAAVNNEGETTNGYLSKAAIGYYDTATNYEYDLEKAKALLAEAGYENGFTFTCYSSSDLRSRSATVIQANLAEIGVTMNIEQMEASTFYEKTGNGEHDACVSGWVANAEPDNTYRPLFTSEKAGAGGNRAFYKNPEVDALVDDAATNRDKAVIEENYKQVTKIISEDAIWVPLYSNKGMVARNANLKGLVIVAMGAHDFYGLHY